MKPGFFTSIDEPREEQAGHHSIFLPATGGRTKLPSYTSLPQEGVAPTRRKSFTKSVEWKMTEQRRPRTTKNVYFFKSGDHQFPGVRLPVNLRRYRNLDAVLDDLSFRIPLPRGVRTLSTPHGRDRVTDLTQLRHNGSYICSDLIQARRVPGVNLSKIKTNSGDVMAPRMARSNSFSAFYTDTGAAPQSPKRTKKKIVKKKKKIKKKKQTLEDPAAPTNEDEQEEAPRDPEFVAMLQERMLATAQSESPDLGPRRITPEEGAERKDQLLDDYPDGGGGRGWERASIAPRSQIGDERRSQIAYQNDLDRSAGIRDGQSRPRTEYEQGGRDAAIAEYYEDDLEELEDEERRDGTSARPRSSLTPNEFRPTTRSGVAHNQNGTIEDELPPLDGDKLTHVQRRRIASNQVDADRYTLPSGSSGIQSNPSPGGDNDQDREISRLRDGVSSLRVDELLSLSDEPATISGNREGRHSANTNNPKREHLQTRRTDSGIPQQICQSYVECRKTVLYRFSHCMEEFSASTPTMSTPERSSSNDSRKAICRSSVEAKLNELRSLRRRKYHQQFDCVQGRIEEAVFVHPKKVRVCKKILDDYNRFLNSTTTNAPTTIFMTTTTSLAPNSTSTTSNPVFSIPPAASTSKPIDSKSPIASTTTTTIPTTTREMATPASDYYDDLENVELEIERRAQQILLLRAAAAKKKRRRRRRRQVNPINRRECRMQVIQQQRECEMLSSCCSEVARCDNDFESSTLYTEIHQLQLEIYNQLRQCQM